MLPIIWLGLVNSLSSLAQIFLIVAPLMVFLEFVKDWGLLDRASKRVEPVLKHFSLSPAAAPALVAGLFIGLIYGAGVLYQTRQEGQVRPREMNILCFFLSLNHAVIEDVAILAALGAQAWVLVVARFIPAVFLTYLLSRWYSRNVEQEVGLGG